MAIPPLTADGVLPPGIHEATLDGVVARFGQTAWVREGRRERLSLSRRHLTEVLQAYVAEIRRAQLAPTVIVNGSYVTNKPDPNDVDLLVELPPGDGPTRLLSPAVLRLLDNRHTLPHYGVNVFDGPEGSLRHQLVTAKWSEVRGKPGMEKGMVRIRL